MITKMRKKNKTKNVSENKSSTNCPGGNQVDGLPPASSVCPEALPKGFFNQGSKC